MAPRVESFFDSARAVSFAAQDFSRRKLRESAAAASWVIVSVLRKAAMCSALAWFATFCCSQGNVFSLTPVRDQSCSSFVGAPIIWCHLLLSTVTLVTLALVLVPQRFSEKPDQALTFWFCFSKLVKRAYLQFVGSALFMALIVYLLSFGSSSVRAMKLEFYFNCPCSHLYTSYADLVTRRIGRKETVQGQQYAKAKAQREPPPPPQSANGPVPAGNQPKHKRRPNWTSYWLHFARTSPMTVFVLITGGCVHAVSSIQHREAQQYFLLFTIGIPTVLIDTQIRLVLQSVQSNSATLSGTLLMALIETAMRLAKVWMIKLETRRLDAAHASINAVVPAPLTVNADAGTETTSPQTEVAWKKRKIMAFHSAELCSDMSAEYITIGCSASIVFFFSSHPKYTINAVQSSTGSVSSSTTGGLDTDSVGLSSWHQLLMLLFQVGVEIVVDWLSATLEVSGGVDFCRFAPASSVHCRVLRQPGDHQHPKLGRFSSLNMNILSRKTVCSFTPVSSAEVGGDTVLASSRPRS